MEVAAHPIHEKWIEVENKLQKAKNVIAGYKLMIQFYYDTRDIQNQTFLGIAFAQLHKGSLSSWLSPFNTMATQILKYEIDGDKASTYASEKTIWCQKYRAATTQVDSLLHVYQDMTQHSSLFLEQLESYMAGTKQLNALVLDMIYFLENVMLHNRREFSQIQETWPLTGLFQHH